MFVVLTHSAVLKSKIRVLEKPWRRNVTI